MVGALTGSSDLSVNTGNGVDNIFLFFPHCRRTSLLARYRRRIGGRRAYGMESDNLDPLSARGQQQLFFFFYCWFSQPELKVFKKIELGS